MKILQMINIANFTLAVYHTSRFCYQYCIINPQGIVYKFDQIFYTSITAEHEGRKAVKIALNL
jgi:hypothetical protein